MWVDTHCHLDAREFEPDLEAVLARARQAGVGCMVVPAVATDGWAQTQALARRLGQAYALGVHPMYVLHEGQALPQLPVLWPSLRARIEQAMGDAALVAVGEIGLDGHVPELMLAQAKALQLAWFRGQLAIAAELGLPVILHVRRSVEEILRELQAMAKRGQPVPGGIAHAFNGSLQQAQAMVALGFKLGFGGAMTYAGSLRIRALAASVGEGDWVLETDAPDIVPSWVREQALRDGIPARNEPGELVRIAQCMAELRGQSLAAIEEQHLRNSVAALPRLQAIVSASMRHCRA